MLAGMLSDMTTVKVRRSTRDLISRAAKEQGSTIDEYLTRLLEEQAWRERMAQAARAMSAPDADYAAEVAEWDDIASDGPV